MPSLQRGEKGRVGVVFTAIGAPDGPNERRHVPAVVPLTAPYPIAADGSDATPVAAGSGVVANAIGAATIPAVVGKTAYITGFDINGAGATAALVVNPTVAGIISGTRTFAYGAVAGAGLMNAPLSVRFCPPIPAAALNQAITVSCPALGAGNVNNCVNAYGFYL